MSDIVKAFDKRVVCYQGSPEHWAKLSGMLFGQGHTDAALIIQRIANQQPTPAGIVDYICGPEMADVLDVVLGTTSANGATPAYVAGPARPGRVAAPLGAPRGALAQHLGGGPTLFDMTSIPTARPMLDDERQNLSVDDLAAAAKGQALRIRTSTDSRKRRSHRTTVLKRFKRAGMLVRLTLVAVDATGREIEDTYASQAMDRGDKVTPYLVIQRVDEQGYPITEDRGDIVSFDDPEDETADDAAGETDDDEGLSGFDVMTGLVPDPFIEPADPDDEDDTAVPDESDDVPAEDV